MTREEALQIIYDHCQHCDKTEKAFEILKENKGDLISRQAVIDALTKTSGIRGDALKALYDLPSVENKGEDRPKGEWHINGYPSNEDIRQCNEDYICSNCKDFVVNRRMKALCNFCPNCGADMRGECE